LRVALFCAALILLFIRPEMLDFPNIFQMGWRGGFLWLIWIILTISILPTIIPNRKIPIGGRKHFAYSYKPTGRPAVETAPNKGILISAISWLAIIAALIAALAISGRLSPQIILLLALGLTIVDYVFILFICPFRVLFMKNRCCATCRIHNWDHLMICAPMAVFPGFFSISLGLLALAAFAIWEIAARRRPHYFISKTNANLNCVNCNDKMCLLHIKRKG